MKTRLLLAACAALFLSHAAHADTAASAPAAGPASVPADAATLYQQSVAQLQQKHAKEAVEFAEQAVKADPTKPEYHSQLGVALSQRMGEVNFMQMGTIAGRMRKAFDKSLELDPKHVAGLIGLSRYYTNAPEIAGGSLEKAATYAQRLRAIDPYVGDIELGNIANKGEDYATALQHYEAASALKPDNASLQNACGRALVHLGRKDEARVRFETALKLKPDLESAKKALAELNAPAK